MVGTFAEKGGEINVLINYVCKEITIQSVSGQVV